jgi:hypothetical protein
VSTTSPTAPGQLGVAARPTDMLEYLGQLDAWLAERRAELDSLDGQILSTGRQQELTGDMSLAMALWQAAKTRQGLILNTWDSGRVGPKELEQLSGLIWGRLDTATSPVAALASMAVSLPEAGRLCDALVAQLRTRLNTDPNAEQQQLRLRELRAQAERIRDQIGLEPPALAGPASSRLSGLVSRVDELTAKRERGGDIAGSLSALEIEAAKFERDLIVGAAQRREARELLDTARQRLAGLTASEQELRAMAAHLSTTVWPAPEVELPTVAGLGPVPNTGRALRGYLSALDALATSYAAAREQLVRADGGVSQVSAQFAALQVRADAAALATDPGLMDLAGAIQTRLAARPVPVRVVQHLLDAYAAELDFRGTVSR